MERSKTARKEKKARRPTLPNQNAILIIIIWYYVTRYRKCTIIIIIVRILPPRGRYINDSTVNFCKPIGPRHTYYHTVVIIVAGKKIQER